jgi:endonuclease/exonuclease/phosphatase family metal-dependent hydrolase
MELDSYKLDNGHEQVKAAVSILQGLHPDILSVNEIQFDFDRAHDEVPQLKAEIEQQAKIAGLNLDAPREPQNLTRLCHLVFGSNASLNMTFAPGNCGLRALRDERGNYLDRRTQANGEGRFELVDNANFGWFPGQYSTALATRLSIVRRDIYSSLKWSDWNPTLDLTRFNFGSGLQAQDVPLFDKNFTVSYLEHEGVNIALIALHAVPAYDFGRSDSPNLLRNYDQLRFLAWFLTGEKDAELVAPAGISPLAADRPFIAAGDFNVEYGGDKPGSKVLRQLLAHPRLHNRLATIPVNSLPPDGLIAPETTFFPYGRNYQKGAMHLDYILVSSQLNIIRLKTLFCSPASRDADPSPDGLTFELLRQASDHLPLLLDFYIE